MKVNGEVKQLPGEITLEEFLLGEGYNTSRIAVEQNENIVPKGEYKKVILSDSDTLEIVTFVGGG